TTSELERERVGSEGTTIEGLDHLGQRLCLIGDGTLLGVACGQCDHASAIAITTERDNPVAGNCGGSVTKSFGDGVTARTGVERTDTGAGRVSGDCIIDL